MIPYYMRITGPSIGEQLDPDFTHGKWAEEVAKLGCGKVMWEGSYLGRPQQTPCGGISGTGSGLDTMYWKQFICTECYQRLPEDRRGGWKSEEQILEGFRSLSKKR